MSALTATTGRAVHSSARRPRPPGGHKPSAHVVCQARRPHPPASRCTLSGRRSAASVVAGTEPCYALAAKRKRGAHRRPTAVTNATETECRNG